MLQDLEEVLNESVQSLQSPSNNNALGLYHMDKMLQEAASLCKEHGVHYVSTNSRKRTLNNGGMTASAIFLIRLLVVINQLKTVASLHF